LRLGVFCGSSPVDAAYVDAAAGFAAAVARAGHGIVYGGASVGLMGVVADAALAAGGEVLGVIPDGLWADEIAHTGLTELRTVSSLTERKALMASLADAFVALPGGYGTLDELFEMVTWTGLGVQAKPSVLFDVEGYWSGLVSFLDGARAAGFVRSVLPVFTDPAELLAALQT
jgi:uncharacterized protein (TIGR00730 family)